MSVRLRRIVIDGVGPLRGVVLEPGDLTVVEGDNEAGKSSIVDALHAWLRARFRRANSVSWPAVRRDLPGFADGRIEVELCGEIPDAPPALLCDNPLLWNLLVIPEGGAAVRAIGQHDWLDEAKRHLTSFDASPLREALRARGGLTPTGRDTREWRERGEELARRRSGLLGLLDSLDRIAEDEARLAAARGRLRELEQDSAAERQAIEFERHDRARRALAEHGAAEREIQGLARYREDDLRRWRDLEGRRIAARVRHDATRAAVAEVEREIERGRRDHAESSDRLAGAERREAAIAASGLAADAADAAAELRRSTADRTAASRSRPAAALAAIGACGLAAGGLLLGRPLAVAVGLALAASAAIAWIALGRRRAGLGRARAAGAACVQDAIRCGLAVREVSEVAGAVGAVRDEVVRHRERLEGIERTIERHEARRDVLHEEARETEAALRATDRELSELRDRSGLAAIEELDERVRRRDAEERRRAAAGAELARLFPAVAPARWASALEEARVEDPGRAPAPGRLAQLERAERRQREEIEQLVTATELALREQLSRLQVPDLAAARDALERIAAEERQRERDREAALLALEAVLDAERDVDGRLDLALREADGGASGLFRELTGGLWAAIRRGDAGLEAVRPDGTALPVRALSRGTLDQLHFALRAALAERVLGGPGFFLWDDTFLTADPTRRGALVTACLALVARGWQILYLTVDPSIAERFEAAARKRGGIALVRVRLEAGVARIGVPSGPER